MEKEEAMRQFFEFIGEDIIVGQNVILTNEGEVKLVDFDIARIYQPCLLYTSRCV